MRFASFSLGGSHHYGRVEGENVVLPSSGYAAACPTLRSAIAAGALARFETVPDAAPLPIAGLQFDPVIPDPGKIICIGQNYRDHGGEGGRPPFPPVFTRFSDTQVGHLAPILVPTESTEFELEGELAVVIGSPGRFISESEALRHVAGYSVYNDASARDWQRHSSQYTAGKNFPGTGAFGPCLVSADEISDPQQLDVVSRVDGIVHQQGTTADMLFSLAELIAYVSRFTPLAPGDVIATGTPGRTEIGRGPARHLKAGSLVEIEISGVGRLANRLVAAGP